MKLLLRLFVGCIFFCVQSSTKHHHETKVERRYAKIQCDPYTSSSILTPPRDLDRDCERAIEMIKGMPLDFGYVGHGQRLPVRHDGSHPNIYQSPIRWIYKTCMIQFTPSFAARQVNVIGEPGWINRRQIVEAGKELVDYCVFRPAQPSKSGEIQLKSPAGFAVGLKRLGRDAEQVSMPRPVPRLPPDWWLRELPLVHGRPAFPGITNSNGYQCMNTRAWNGRRPPDGFPPGCYKALNHMFLQGNSHAAVFYGHNTKPPEDLQGHVGVRLPISWQAAHCRITLAMNMQDTRDQSGADIVKIPDFGLVRFAVEAIVTHCRGVQSTPTQQFPAGYAILSAGNVLVHVEQTDDAAEQWPSGFSSRRSRAKCSHEMASTKSLYTRGNCIQAWRNLLDPRLASTTVTSIRKNGQSLPRVYSSVGDCAITSSIGAAEETYDAVRPIMLDCVNNPAILSGGSIKYPNNAEFSVFLDPDDSGSSIEPLLERGHFDFTVTDEPYRLAQMYHPDGWRPSAS